MDSASTQGRGSGSSTGALRWQRERETERRLREEVEVLTLYRSLIEDAPDLFSLHGVDLDAPFSFASAEFYQRLQVAPEHVLGRPLASIVDPRDVSTLRTGINQVFNDPNNGHGTEVQLRLACNGLSCQASMTIAMGSQGLVVVTRLYGV